MTSELSCSICLATFSRSEHLKRHSISHYGDRPHSCEFCGTAFNRKDVLRRHEKTCRARCPSTPNAHFQSSQHRDAKRHCAPTDSNDVSGFTSAVEPGGADSRATSEALVSSRSSQRHHMPGDPDDENASLMEPGGQCISWLGEEPTIFNVLNQFGDDFVDMTLPVDISALDSILFRQHNSDLPVAERLEFMAHFTSTQGMRTFTDQESFRRKQKMAYEAYEQQLALQSSDKEKKAKRIISHHGLSDVKIEHEKQDMDDVDALQIRSCELIDKIADVICNKTNNDFITIEWTSAIEQTCKGFFCPSNIHRFLEYFWSLWYPNCPIVHKPLFDASSVSAELLCVMVLIGACLSPNENDNEISRKWLDSVEELTFRQVYFRSDRELLLDEPSQRKGIVQCMQAAYLVCSLQKREGSAEAQARIRRHRHASMVTLVRHIGPRKATHRYRELSSISESWWQQFAEEEEFIRTTIFVFLIDAALTILHNSPPRMVVPELKMDVATPESCFQAESALDCMEQLRNWAETRFWKNRLSVVSVVRRICQGPIEESLIQDFACLGTLNLFTMVQAIHSLMFQLHNSLVFESTLAPITTGLENWRQIWSVRIPEDTSIPDVPENLWKRVGFLRHASEFWQLARLLLGKIITNNQDDTTDFEGTEQLSRYDHTDMGEVNELIMEYRRMNLGVT